VIDGHVIENIQHLNKMFHVPAGEIHAFADPSGKKRVFTVTGDQLRKTAPVFRIFEGELIDQFF
jgi:hypothetical protein